MWKRYWSCVCCITWNCFKQPQDRRSILLGVSDWSEDLIHCCAVEVRPGVKIFLIWSQWVKWWLVHLLGLYTAGEDQSNDLDAILCYDWLKLELPDLDQSYKSERGAEIWLDQILIIIQGNQYNELINLKYSAHTN